MKRRLVLSALILLASTAASSAQTVWVSRMWHQHQPTYWPDWNGNGSQTNRVQYAWDSIVLKNNGTGQQYGTGTAHPDNDLNNIFGLPDRQAAYQSGPRNSLANLSSSVGFCMSYSGSLIDNIRSLGAQNQLGYGSGWWSGNREARNWTTPGGSRRMDLVGFTYHHSLAPLLPKAVFRKEMQIFKQAWWKAWGGNSNLSDHSKGFFPTEMAFSSDMIDVLSDEGYQWSIVASHHLSRTCPTYNTKANPTGTYQIKSSPPNKADQLGPSPTNGWWFNEPNPGQATWNVSPHAYQLHRIKYVNPNTGAEKSLIAVPSDDTLSYVAGYSGAQVGMISTNIAPYATDSNRPVIVMPSTDGDNAWGGGSSSYFESTPSFFSGCQSAGYQVCAIQDMVNSKPPPAGQYAHIEDGAWIFPESDYGSPYFLKWIEPPVGTSTSTTKVPGTVIDLETPGFALKFWSWAPVITGANWCETAEQMLIDEGGTVAPWKIQAPYDWDGSSWNPAPNDVELAWHIYLAGLDSGFNYYGGLGNDDEVKQSLATRRAIEKLSSFVNARLANDRTPPSVLKPQRFPWNPGAYTFGWFNSIPGGNTNYLKKMGSDFYIWTHAYDISGVSTINVKVRFDNDGVNSMSTNHNETYAGGADVGPWQTIAMTKRALPKTQSALNAAANNGQINYFITPPELADYYFVKISESNLPGFRNKLLDYYIEATDAKGNVSKSEIQHVWVEDDGAVLTPQPPATPTNLAVTAQSTTSLQITWNASANASNYILKRDGVQIAAPTGTSYTDTGLTAGTTYAYTVAAQNAAGTSVFSSAVNGSTPTPQPPTTPTGLAATGQSTTSILISWSTVATATSYIVKRNGTQIANPTTTSFTDSGLTASTTYAYTVAAVNDIGVSAFSTAVNGTTQAPVPPGGPAFVLDGSADFSNYVQSNPAMRIWCAIRGSKLYVATWSPGSSGGVNDHFILVSNSLLASASAAAPWSKAGFTAHPSGKPYIGAESSNSYCGWFNAPASSTVAKSATNAGQLEGVIDLVEAFGSMPSTVYVAALAYGTADASALASQGPGGNGNGNVEPGEFISVFPQALYDRNADGTYDRLDPALDFVLTASPGTGRSMDLNFATVPGKSYQVQFTNDLTQPWQNLGSAYTATTLSAALNDPDAPAQTRRFYRIVLQ